MTKKEFYKEYWPKIKGVEVDIKSGYVQPTWHKNVIIEDVSDRGRDVYIKYKEGSGARNGHPIAACTIRSIIGIATSIETDLNKNA